MVAASLRNKGFKPREGDHTFYRFYVYGKRTPVHTKISHGATECSTPLLSQMAKQVHLTSAEFVRLLNCPMKTEEYVRILCERGVLNPREVPQISMDEIAVSDDREDPPGRGSGS